MSYKIVPESVYLAYSQSFAIRKAHEQLYSELLAPALAIQFNNNNNLYWYVLKNTTKMQYQTDNKDGKGKRLLQHSCLINKYKQVIILHAKNG